MRQCAEMTNGGIGESAANCVRGIILLFVQSSRLSHRMRRTLRMTLILMYQNHARN